MEFKINEIKIQFLRGIPSERIDFMDIFKEISWNNQQKLLNETILSEKNQKYPLKNSYQVSFLKYIIKQLEVHGCEEIFDLFYERLTSLLLEEEEEEFSYKHFLIDDGVYVTLKESNSFIRDGTTGLKLWPASVKLSEFILTNKELFKGKTILELGSGSTGFVGMTILNACKPKKIYLSDCHDVVIRNLIENVSLNIQEKFDKIENSVLVRQRLKFLNSLEFGVLSLPWEEIDAHKDELKSICSPDLILAADVIYDQAIFVPLIKCLSVLFQNSEKPPEFILSQTIRNENTFDQFCNLLEQSSFKISELSSNDQNEEENVKIFKIK